MKMIAFPFAGGNKTSFKPLFENCHLEVVTVNYPGRGTRIREPLLTNIKDLIDDILDQVLKEVSSGEDYILYGHSMGALVGFLVSRRLSKMPLKQPLKLVVSGHKAPIYPRSKKLAMLEDDAFWEEVNKYGGMPEQLKEYPDLIQFFIPILRADFACLEQYVYEKDYKLHIPIDVFYGSEESISYKQAKDWQMETTATVSVSELAGGHFFIFQHQQSLLQRFLVNSKMY